MDSGFGLAYHAVDGRHITERSQATTQPYITIENNRPGGNTPLTKNTKQNTDKHSESLTLFQMFHIIQMLEKSTYTQN